MALFLLFSVFFNLKADKKVMYGEMMYLKEEIRDAERKIDSVIEEKIRWQYSKHPNMSNIQIQQRLDEFDNTIKALQQSVKSMSEEVNDIRKLLDSF